MQTQGHTHEYDTTRYDRRV